ncbi:MAG: hypothetical protein IJ879_09190, partial [Muribaculaceae bacterium]|nr:hypothetical protein [Muribaculaceae bacterium]
KQLVVFYAEMPPTFAEGNSSANRAQNKTTRCFLCRDAAYVRLILNANYANYAKLGIHELNLRDLH